MTHLPSAVYRVNGTGTFTPCSPAERAFASELVAYWLSFVRAGDPNTHKLSMSPMWEHYTSHSKACMVLIQDPRNSTTNSGSYMEEEFTAEGVRRAIIISKVLYTED
ncbi:hypothetical protein JVU11DRAFT_12897 [Chiua virens]|nr:hypothetical protein JVU11DRAFT_12897 [Chiua virens]